ncbi:MAG: PilZ domain-containing protein [Methylobacterium sp.]
MSIDQRQTMRMRTFLKGRIVFNNGCSTMDCLIRDMSGTGARLELSETTTLPEVFDLYIQNKAQTYRSTLRWRRANGVGVTFDDMAAQAVPTAAPASQITPQAAAADPSLTMLVRRITELEAENAALRSVIASMGETTSSAA